MMVFLLTVLFGRLMWAQYLGKTSRYFTSDNSKLIGSATGERVWTDKLICTSGVYGIASLYAIFAMQYFFALLCGITCIGSTYYHKYREMKYFNCDNIFATALLVIYVWSLYHAFINDAEVYFNSGYLSLVAIFLLVYCGMPADITFTEEKPQCCIRSGRPEYDTYHAAWHITSGLGLLLSIWYFAEVDNDMNRNSNIDLTCFCGRAIMGSSYYLDCHECFPVVPCLALGVSIFINMLGNAIGVMPLD